MRFLSSFQDLVRCGIILLLFSSNKPDQHFIGVNQVLGLASSSEEGCDDTEFQCVKAPGECIPLTKYCDGEDDCPDKSDESDCDGSGSGDDDETPHITSRPASSTTTVKPPESDFVLSSEESTHRPTCPDDKFACTTANKCIDKGWVCDGDVDCPDSSDEAPGNCLKVVAPTNANDPTCVSSVANKCTLYESLLSGHIPKLALFYDLKFLKLMTLNEMGGNASGELHIPPEMHSINALTYNHVTHKFIWSDSGARKIYEYDMATDQLSVLIENVPGKVTSMDIDIVSQNLYWVSIGRKGIDVMSLETGARITIAANVENVRNIFIDTYQRAIFVFAPHKTGAHHGPLYKMDLNGENLTLLQTITATIVAYDVVLQKFFWMSHETTSIQSMWSNGTLGLPSGELGPDTNHPLAMVAYYGQIFWAHGMGHVVKSIRTTEVLHHSPQVYTVISDNHVTNIKLLIVDGNLSLLKHFLDNHECTVGAPNSKSCSHVCVPVGHELQGECLCELGFTLRDDGVTCTEGHDTTEMLIIAGIIFVVIVIAGLIALALHRKSSKRATEVKAKESNS